MQPSQIKSNQTLSKLSESNPIKFNSNQCSFVRSVRVPFIPLEKQESIIALVRRSMTSRCNMFSPHYVSRQRTYVCAIVPFYSQSVLSMRRLVPPPDLPYPTVLSRLPLALPIRSILFIVASMYSILTRSRAVFVSYRIAPHEQVARFH